MLVPRENPLDLSSIEKLETVFEKNFQIKEKLVEIRIPIKDDLGIVYKHEIDLVSCGFEIVQKSEADPRLLDSIKRPATRATIMAHLSRLSAHKRYTQGASGLEIVISDIAKHLEGCSEYAVIKILRDFQLDPSPFWPETGKIVERIKNLSDQISYLGEKKQEQTPPPKCHLKKSPRDKRERVSKIVSQILKGETLSDEDKTFWEELRKQS